MFAARFRMQFFPTADDSLANGSLAHAGSCGTSIVEDVFPGSDSGGANSVTLIGDKIYYTAKTVKMVLSLGLWTQS